jgi:glyceraldehyde 3-phosphate dehydrogenase
MATVAISGLGGIGRAALKILLEADGLDLVAVNDIAEVDNLAYRVKYDTVYGRYHREVSAAEGALVVDGSRISALAESDPANLPWDDLGIAWSSSARGPSPPSKTWRGMFGPARRT